MKTKDIVTTVWVIIIVLTFLFGLFGCQEAQKSPVWGQGNPDSNYIENFGNGNLARLCFVQTQRINNQAKLIAELITLNAKQHKIMGEKDIDLYNRIRKLEEIIKQNMTIDGRTEIILKDPNAP